MQLVLSRLERAGLIQRSGERVIVYDMASIGEFLHYLEMQWKFGDL